MNNQGKRILINLTLLLMGLIFSNFVSAAGSIEKAILKIEGMT